MKRQEYGSLGLGASSILLIAVVLCLTVLCTLALLSARADARLTQKTLAAAQAYYAADAAAQQKLAEIDAQLASSGNVTLEGVSESNGEIAFEIDVDASRRLEVKLERTPKGLERYRIIAYNVTNRTDWSVTNDHNLYGTGVE